MKNKFLLGLLAPMLLASVAGCNNIAATGMKLTYGTYLTTEDEKLTDAKEIDFADLSLRMEAGNQYAQENFLLVIAPTNRCSCWANFKPVLKKFISETNYLVYQMKVTDFSEEKYGLVFKEGYVSLSIIKAGKIIKSYLSGNTSIFESTEALKAEMNKYVRAPELYYVDGEFLNDYRKTDEQFLVAYVRCNCSDCNYSTPKALWPYAYAHNFKTRMYVYDMQDLYDNASAEDYQEFKDVHYLSEKLSPEFGYGNGVVPTIQYYDRRVLTDATVFFNDKVEKIDGEYRVTKSFYSSQRLASIKYAANIKEPVLEGLTIPASDVIESQWGASWIKEKAFEYHKPLFDAFMNMYAI